MVIERDDFAADADHERAVTGESPSEAVVLAVADARDVSPTDLPPLHDALDPDALDALFAETLRGRARAGGHVAFDYVDTRVVVFDGGRVFVGANSQ